MISDNSNRLAHRVWLAISIALFLGAVYFVAVGYRALHNWLLLASTFANVMVFALLIRHRSRAG